MTCDTCGSDTIVFLIEELVWQCYDCGRLSSDE